jgi:hypothetical protein
MLTVKLPPDVEQKLARRAAAAGEPVESLASRLLAEAVNAPTIDEILAPVRQRVAASGMTEDQLADLLEAEKHAMRNDRRDRRAS